MKSDARTVWSQSKSVQSVLYVTLLFLSLSSFFITILSSLFPLCCCFISLFVLSFSHLVLLIPSALRTISFLPFFTFNHCFVLSVLRSFSVTSLLPSIFSLSSFHPYDSFFSLSLLFISSFCFSPYSLFSIFFTFVSFQQWIFLYFFFYLSLLNSYLTLFLDFLNFIWSEYLLYFLSSVLDSFLSSLLCFSFCPFSP